MNKLGGSFLILFFCLIISGSQEVAAQGLFARLFGTGGYYKHKLVKHKRYQCGDMEAYNKHKAYKKHSRSRLRRMFKRQIPPQAEKDPVARTKSGKKLTPPAPKLSNRTENPPQKLTSPAKPVPGQDPPPVLAEKTPPQQPDPIPAAKKDKPQLTRTSLKKMTSKERRDTLQHMQPQVVLEPLQFLSDQDEFSVVNMDSFMKAMEYAQQGKVVLVEGHTDDLGSEQYNLDLSMKRAEKIRELLLSGGISDELISVIGYGENQPLVPNNSDKNRAINRRIEFRIFSLPE